MSTYFAMLTFIRRKWLTLSALSNQFLEPDNFGLIALRMVFYETAETYVSFKGKNAKEPFDLGMKFMQNGFKTTFEVGDEKFEFNK
ncbi:hypothetical protein [Xanthomarina gelatinilytica]|uniref:hypothetical protein n=1 Tax=Xanthomarina gelatinilytica TaxID=1137281 RepID=UPI003AA90A0F